MNTSPSTLAVLAMFSLLLHAWPAPGAALDIWVAPDGSDANPGSSNAPLASVAAAFEKAQSAAAEQGAQSNSLRIILGNGVYPLVQPILIRSSDARLHPFPIRVEAAPGAHPVLSGGTAIKHWERLSTGVPGLSATARENIWTADLPRRNWRRRLEFRQLWVNDRKAVRAREPNGEDLARLVAWDKTNQVATIPARTLAGVKNAMALEMIVEQVWEIAVLRVQSIRTEGTNALLTFERPESQIEFQHPWPPVTVNAKYQAPFYLANAVEFLDEPGEWFEDLAAGKIYYWPRPGEDMTRAEVFAPTLETLVQIDGAAGDALRDIQFKGITFAHTTWLRPSQAGHVPLQASMFMLDAKKLATKGMPYHPGLDNLAWIGRPPAAVSVRNARSISFENCRFEHLASAGLDFDSGTREDTVEGCVFRDIGGNGLQLGKFSDTNVETHVPYNPPDEREICTHVKIANNVITDCGNEDWGCVGISVGYARNISIAHNEIFGLPYTGISMGWGWTKITNALRDNFIFANRIHDVGRRLGDLAGIYTLSAQPGTVVAENSVYDIAPSPFVPDTNHWFYLYLDEGSSFVTVRDNWCPSEKFLKNANGPGNVWTNNGPKVSEKIKNAAGLEPVFKGRLREVR